jgi:hypothetical protein
MRRITPADSKAIVQIIHAWKSRRLTWKSLQERISTSLLNGERAWSRQSLQANVDINAAWDKFRARQSVRRAAKLLPPEAMDAEVDRLQTELDELQGKYDALLARHRVLIYNASLLPGGTQLLAKALPDNTRSQSEPNSGKPRRSK